MDTITHTSFEHGDLALLTPAQMGETDPVAEDLPGALPRALQKLRAQA